MSMHPVEHLLYFSVVVPHMFIVGHPIHLLFNAQHTGLTPAGGHHGFDGCEGPGPTKYSGSYFHYLHHRYFEVRARVCAARTAQTRHATSRSSASLSHMYVMSQCSHARIACPQSAVQLRRVNYPAGQMVRLFPRRAVATGRQNLERARSQQRGGLGHCADVRYRQCCWTAASGAAAPDCSVNDDAATGETREERNAC